MNAVTTSPAGPPTRVEREKAPQVLERTLLAPFRALGSISVSHPRWLEMVDAGLITAEEVRTNENARRAAEQIVAEVPEGDILQRIGAAVQTLAAQPADRRRNWLIIANMLDGYPNAKPNSPAVYIEQLVQDVTVDAFQPCVVARAADAWGRANRFPPTRAEFLDACQQERKFLSSIGDAPIRAAQVRDAAAAALATVGGRHTSSREV